ncbi:MAG: type IV secretion system protein [Campylobacteraceae bacterium]|jgi:type IV secretion system protein VirB6|nr:type IV secretion system protein [Campylobacteraceae bacterium]
MAGIFANIQNQIDQMVEALNDAMVGEMIKSLTSILAISITIYVIYKAYMIWAGKMQEPMKDIMWDFAGKALVIAFAFGAKGWLDMSVEAINNLHEWAGGGLDLFSELDDMVDKAILMDEYILSYNQEVIYPFLVTGKWIGVGLGIAVPFFTMMMAKISLQLLTITAPIFIFCKLFGFMKGMFEGWLKLIFMNILITLFLTIIIQTSAEFMGWLIEQCLGLAANGAEMVFYMIIGGIFQAVLAKLAVTIAQNISSINIESIKSIGGTNVNVNSLSSRNNSYGYYGSNSNYLTNRAFAAALMTRSFFSKAGDTIEQTGRNITNNTSKAFRQYKSNLFRSDK